MLKNLLRVYLFLFIVALSDSANALDVPPLKGRVNDYAGLLPSARAQALEQRLAQFENETGHQIAVLTIPSLQGEDIESFSIRVAENWKIGKKGFDNGAILVIAHKDKRLRIEVGYGLEGVLPDAIASRIINEVIVPRFRNGDFPGGIEAGVESVMKVTRGEPLAEAQRRQPAPSSRRFPAHLVLPLLLLGFWLVSALTPRRHRSAWSGRRGRGYFDSSGGFFPGGFGGGGFGGGGFSGGGGGFSGGGGGFGGGGASGRW
ncbi:MAG: TPM domain-containing protein [Candidatus Binatia bacterium]